MEEINELEKNIIPDGKPNNDEKTKKMEIEFDKQGFEYAHNTNANISIFKNGLDSVYQFFLKEQKLDKEAVKTRIETLHKKREDIEKSNIEKSSEIEKVVIQNEKYQADVEKHKEEILKLENDIVEIKKKDPPKGDETMLNVYMVGAVALLIATLMMYMATFGSGILGLEPGSPFIRPTVFQDLLDSGIGNLILTVVVSFIPIGCGYYYTTYRKENKIGAALSFLIVVLLVDIMIGYMISKSIYINEYEEGHIYDPWEWYMFIKDPGFYTVLVINFALYYTFAECVDRFFVEKKNLQPDFVIQKEIEQVQNKIDALDGKVKELEQIINENKQKIKDLEGQIEQNKITIEKIKNLIIAYENGRIPIDASYLKSLISKYMEGYARYVSGKYKHDESKEKEIKDKIEEERNKWYKDKEESWV